MTSCLLSKACRWYLIMHHQYLPMVVPALQIWATLNQRSLSQIPLPVSWNGLKKTRVSQTCAGTEGEFAKTPIHVV